MVINLKKAISVITYPDTMQILCKYYAIHNYDDMKLTAVKIEAQDN
ncbi:hypothetical protein ASZ90_019125 [hydrocarbon metagenome]|uniref:Uncharacterized protein n=1 Tax=hydrocarbon metagenome TaxID=938273 RepID=A0A0W8E513_9ZZZZ